MTAKTEVSNKIKAYKHGSGLSIRQLAELCGVKKSAITNWMAGHTRPTIDHLVSLANIFEIDPGARVEFYESATQPAQQAEGPNG